MIPNAPKHYETHQNMSLWSNVVDQMRSLQKLQRDFVARTFALIEPVQVVLQQVSYSYETIPNAPKHYETHQNMSLWSNGCIRCIGCENLPRDFMAQTFALIAPFQLILHRVSCSNEMVPNTMKHDNR